MTRLNRSRIKYTPGLCATSCTFFCRSGFSFRGDPIGGAGMYARTASLETWRASRCPESFRGRRSAPTLPIYVARRRGIAECTIINSVTFSGVSKPTRRFIGCRVCCQRAEFAHHRTGNRKPARDIFHLRQGCLLRCADVNKKRDENQEWIKKQSDKTERKREALANQRSDLRRTRIRHACRQQRTQHAPAIHWKCGK